MDGWMNGWISEWISERLSAWASEWISVRVKERMEIRLSNGSVSVWLDGRLNERMNKVAGTIVKDEPPTIHFDFGESLGIFFMSPPLPEIETFFCQIQPRGSKKYESKWEKTAHIVWTDQHTVFGWPLSRVNEPQPLKSVSPEKIDVCDPPFVGRLKRSNDRSIEWTSYEPLNGRAQIERKDIVQLMEVGIENYWWVVHIENK